MKHILLPKLLCGLLLTAATNVFGQLPLGSATLSITMQCSGGTGNRTGIAYNPDQQLYYSVNAGSSSYPIETFNASGTSVSSNSAGFDFRGAWWNPNTDSLEGNGYSNNGIRRQDLNGSYYALSTGVVAIPGVSGPNSQSSANYDYNADEILYYYNGVIYRYTRSNHTLISSVSVSNLPVAFSSINSNSIAYTGVSGMEAGLYDHVNKRFYFVNKVTGAYVQQCTLPNTAPAATVFKMGFANGYLWLYNSGNSQWEGYQTVLPCNPLNITVTPNDTVCQGDSVTIIGSSNGTGVITWDNNISNGVAFANILPGVTTYTSTSTDTNDCETEVVINVLPTPFDTIDHTICNHDTVEVNGNAYHAGNLSGVEVFTAASGCDSIVAIDLTALPAIASTISNTICDGDSLVVNGTTYNAANLNGVEVFSGAGQLGCDSTVTINLSVYPENIEYITNTVCDDESFLINGTVYDASNPVGVEIFPNGGVNGCDSTVDINLNVIAPRDLTVTNASPILTSNQQAATYQWLDCDNDFASISGATNQSYEATANGNFAVEVSLAGCVDTSDCHSVTGVGVAEYGPLRQVQIYPNPTEGKFNINLVGIDGSVDLILRSVDGKVLSTTNSVDISNAVVDLSGFENGIYLLTIDTEIESRVFSVIKQ